MIRDIYLPKVIEEGQYNSNDVIKETEYLDGIEDKGDYH